MHCGMNKADEVVMMKEKENLVLAAEGVSRSYRAGSHSLKALKDVSVSLRSGEKLAITGESGAGKSTLMHILGGLDKPSRGKVCYRGADLSLMAPKELAEFRASKIGFVFQSYYLLPELDVLENTLLPSLARTCSAKSRAENRRRALDLLAQVGLQNHIEHRPTELSGGEQQRLALARALMNNPEVILADEPTGNLDSNTGERVLRYLFDLTSKMGHTLVIVTHNEKIAACCDREVHLKDGFLN